MIVTHDMNSVLGIGDNILFIKEILQTTNNELRDFVYASEFLKQLKPAAG